MTPVEIAEYKQRWMPGYAVRLHSDLRTAGKDWCKQLHKYEWAHKKWTDVYEDTFYFESPYVGQNFEHDFATWVQKS
jgi:hypothetical protein